MTAPTLTFGRAVHDKILTDPQ